MLGGTPTCPVVARPSVPFVVRRDKAGRKLDGVETVLSFRDGVHRTRVKTSSRFKTGCSCNKLKAVRGNIQYFVVSEGLLRYISRKTVFIAIGLFCRTICARCSPPFAVGRAVGRGGKPTCFAHKVRTPFPRRNPLPVSKFWDNFA